MKMFLKQTLWTSMGDGYVSPQLKSPFKNRFLFSFKFSLILNFETGPQSSLG